MAEIIIRGFVVESRITKSHDNIVVTIDEYSPGYTHTRTKEKVQGRMIRWKVLFPAYFIKFIKNNFQNGSHAQIKGTARPYVEKDINDESVGIAVCGETIRIVRNDYNMNVDEKRIAKNQDSERLAGGLDDYLREDF